MDIYSLDNEIAFWGNQVREHMSFLVLGLREFGKEAAALENSWKVILQEGELERVKQLLETTMKLQQEILTVQRSGRVIGWLPYSFIEHIQREAQYFMNKLNGEGYNLQQELAFWLWHHDSETEATIKFLDPKMISWEKQARDYVAKVKAQLKARKDVTDMALTSMDEFVDFTTELEKAIHDGKVLSVITDTLIAHVIREGERALDIFDALLSGPEAGLV